MPAIDKSTLEELSRFFAPAYVREEVEKLRGWQHQLALDTSFGRVINSPTWISGTSIQNGTIDAQKLNVGELRAITANTGNLVVAGAGGQAANGQLAIAADPNTLLASAIIMRATADAQNEAGITFRNASGVKTVELKLDGSGRIGATTAITWNAAGTVSIPSELIAGGITVAITDVTGGRIGGTYDVMTAAESYSTHPYIRIDPDQGIGIFGPHTGQPNWNNARVHLRKDGSAKFTNGIEIQSSYGNADLRLNTTDGVLMRKSLGGGNYSTVFQLTTAGDLRIRSARIGDDFGGDSNKRIEITSSGITGFSGAGQSTFNLSNDGSGYIKAGTSGTYAIQWNQSSLSINASVITAGTITADRISGGTLSGSFSTGTNSIDAPNSGAGGIRAGTNDDATFRGGKLTVTAIVPNVRVVSAIAGAVSGLYLNAVASSGDYAYIDHRGGTSVDNPSWTGGRLYYYKTSPTAYGVSLYIDSTTHVYSGIGGSGARGQFTVQFNDSAGAERFFVNNPSLTLLALASNGSLFYRGATTTAGLGAYKGAIVATVKIGTSDVAVKIPLYE